jgi:uracil-DNA glycosylase
MPVQGKLIGGAPASVLDDPTPAARIPFYPPGQPATWFPGGVDVVEPIPANSGCRRCSLARSTKTVCMASVGPASAPLLVLPSPTQRDDVAGVLVESGSSLMAIDEAKKHAPLVRVTWAVRCAAGRNLTDDQLRACRPYLAGELDPARVPRAVLFGEMAALVATGRVIHARRLRRARAVIRGVPCFLVMDPGQTVKNRFVLRQFKADVEWAMKAPVFERPDGEVEILLSPARAVEWLAARTRDPITVDAEWWPKNVWAKEDFRLLCLGLCQDPRAPVSIPEEVLKDPGVVEALRRVLEDPAFPKVNQNIKADVHAIWRGLGVDVVGIEADTMLWSRLRDAEAPAGLRSTAWHVAWGGYKELGVQGADEDDDE